MKPEKPAWKALFEAALAENRPTKRLARLLRTAEVAMTRAAQDMMNAGSSQPEYDELMLAMRVLYEHGLRKGMNVPEGTFSGQEPSARTTPLTTKQLKSVACPRCGAKSKEPCRLPNGKSRTAIQLDRRRAAKLLNN
jgi:hypothetical protein